MSGAGAGITVEEYSIHEYNGTATYVNTSGKVSESTPAQAGTGIFICGGQSLMGNHGVSDYDPGSANVLQLNVNADGVYRCKDPVLGATGTIGGFVSRLGAQIVADGIFSRVLMVPIAIGGSSMSQWSPNGVGITTSGMFFHRLRVAILRCRKLGLTPTAFLWEQGQSDLGTSEAVWQSYLRSLVDSAIGLQCTAPWFVAKCTMNTNVVDATIQGAQTGLWNTTYNGVNIYPGPDIDALTGATNRSDGTHLTDIGNAAAAVRWSTALNSVF